MNLHAESLSVCIRIRPDVVVKWIFGIAGDWPNAVLILSGTWVSFSFHPRKRLQYEQIVFCKGLIAMFSFLFKTAI